MDLSSVWDANEHIGNSSNLQFRDLGYTGRSSRSINNAKCCIHDMPDVILVSDIPDRQWEVDAIGLLFSLLP